ncbi:NUDIX domain-containing protein [Streptomyces sp. NPDC004520]|uniref:NUDIX domain-containing protein n=1 Tax=Streptomyces sp. NPDC004520 TaxID=3364702 RepID=UPI003673AD73
MCSCRHETRISGGPAVLWVGFRKDGLTWTGPGGEPRWYATWPTLRRGFCPRCGTHLVSVADDSDMVMVTGFSLDDRSGTDPVGHSYRQEAVPWMTVALADGPGLLPAAPRTLDTTGGKMPATSRPEASPGTAMTDEEYGEHRASAALWVGTSVLITDERGRVLVQHVDYRDTCLLPGGALDKGESPAHGAARELHEELGVSMVIERGLAVDWVSVHGANAPAPVRFPGEILHVFDGGTWDSDRIAAVVLPEGEITDIDFVEPADLPGLMSPGDARRALAALRARTNGAGAVLLEDGRPLAPTLLDQVNAFALPRATHHWPWRSEPVPSGMPVRQCRGWLFAPDGRVLVLLDPANGSARLPGGTPEAEDRGDPAATLIREAAEEAAVRISAPVLLGHLPDERHGSGPCAHVRMAAALTHVGPSRPDPATGRTRVRALATPEQVLELFDWGPCAAEQLASVHRERARLGLPRAARRPLALVTGDEDLI